MKTRSDPVDTFSLELPDHGHDSPLALSPAFFDAVMELPGVKESGRYYGRRIVRAVYLPPPVDFWG